MTFSNPSLAERATAVLQGNDRGGYTLPSPHLYPHQWAWDSAFAAIGWAHLDLDRAVTELEILMRGAWPDGRVPHIYFHDKSADYFPGPEMWETETSTSISQPPVWATAARRVLELGGDTDRIRALLPAIDASHRWFSEHRDPENKGLVAIVHPWESGLDNSPAWDRPMEAVDANAAPPFKRVDLERVDDVGQRPGDTEYKRYVVLVKEIAKSGFGPGIFSVYDPLMTSLLAKAEADLAWLGQRLGVETRAEERGERLVAGLLEHLWDETLGRFVHYDVVAKELVTPNVVAGYLPLVLDIPSDKRERLLEGLRADFWTQYPLPSTSPKDSAFEPRRYWRGPTWINTNWLLAAELDEALGTDLVGRSLSLMERAGFREYYHPETGEGLGAKDFAWSAALALDWMRGDASQ